LFSVDNPTLNRFYSAHYLLPFILAGLSILHLAALHQYGSTNPIGVNAQTDLIPFYPYYVLKDLVGLFVLAIFAGILVFFYPDILGLKLAVKNSKIFNNYDDSICWNIFSIYVIRSSKNNSAKNNNFIKKDNAHVRENAVFPFDPLSGISQKKEKAIAFPFQSLSFQSSLIVFSETICVTPKKMYNTKQRTKFEFNTWLAGLIDQPYNL